MKGIWLSREEIQELPMVGLAWDAVREAAALTGVIDLSNQEETQCAELLASAYVAARMDNLTLAGSVAERIQRAMSTVGGRTLALGRNLKFIVAAADVVQWSTPEFCTWLRGVMRLPLEGKTIISTHEDRPNNWGTEAGASRLFADLFLARNGTDAQRVEALADGKRAIDAWRGWLGDRSAYAGFKFSDPMSWHADPAKPVGVNPKDSVIQGHNADGILPDDQRRGGGFTWPPPKENYVWTALAGVTPAVALMARHLGPRVLRWSDSAHLRAVEWLYGPCQYPASGDDEWQIPLINWLYGTSYRWAPPARNGNGKGFAWTDWTHGLDVA